MNGLQCNIVEALDISPEAPRNETRLSRPRGRGMLGAGTTFTTSASARSVPICVCVNNRINRTAHERRFHFSAVHDQMSRTHVQGYESSGEYVMTINYNISAMAIEELMMVVQNCRSETKYTVKMTVLLGPSHC